MRLKYLGTAAAEGVPSLFCDCPICERARKEQGREIRTRSQALLDDFILLDFPPDSYAHFIKHHINSSKLEHIVITHTHNDHFYPDDFENILKGYANRTTKKSLTVYGSEDLLDSCFNKFLNNECNTALKYQKFEPYHKYDIGGYTFIPLPAVHTTPHPYIYLISHQGKTLLYCHDSAFPSPEVLAYLETNHVQIDLASLDCTAGHMGPYPYPNHMSLADDINLKNYLLEHHIANEKTIFVLNHFSHNGPDNSYAQMVEITKPYGFIISYDGLEITF